MAKTRVAIHTLARVSARTLVLEAFLLERFVVTVPGKALRLVTSIAMILSISISSSPSRASAALRVFMIMILK